MGIKYHFKRLDLRTNVNLMDFENEIVKSVQSVLTDDVIVKVYTDYYEIFVDELNSVDARKIGKEIIKSSEKLNEYIKIYNYKRSSGEIAYSTQLFIRKN